MADRTFNIHKEQKLHIALQVEDGPNQLPEVARLMMTYNDVTLAFDGAMERDGQYVFTIPALRQYGTPPDTSHASIEVVLDEIYSAPLHFTIGFEGARAITASLLGEDTIKATSAAPLKVSVKLGEDESKEELLKKRLADLGKRLSDLN